MRFFPVLLHQARKELRKKTQTVRHERNNWLLCKAIIFKSVRCGWNGGRGDELDTNTRSSKKNSKIIWDIPNRLNVLCCATVSHARFVRSYSNQHKCTCMHTHYIHMISSANKQINEQIHTYIAHRKIKRRSDWLCIE